MLGSFDKKIYSGYIDDRVQKYRSTVQVAWHACTDAECEISD